MLIGEINALSNASIRTNKDKTLPRLAQAIIKAKHAIDKAIEYMYKLKNKRQKGKKYYWKMNGRIPKIQARWLGREVGLSKRNPTFILLADWELASKGEFPFPIEPLK